MRYDATQKCKILTKEHIIVWPHYPINEFKIICSIIIELLFSLVEDGGGLIVVRCKVMVRIFPCKVWLQKFSILFSRLEGFRDMTE